jgi:hypothetical protein
MEWNRVSKRIFTQELEGSRRRGRPRKGWKEDVERDLQVLGVRRWRECVKDRKKMEGDCLTGPSPQRAVVPMEEEEEEEEEEEKKKKKRRKKKNLSVSKATEKQMTFLSLV